MRVPLNISCDSVPGRLSAAVLLLWGVLGAASSAAPDSGSYTHTLTSDRVDGIHEDLEVEIAPIELGVLVIQLSAPSYRLEVLEHELQLGPVEDGAEIGRVRVRFRGKAHVVAEIGVGDVTSELDDDLELPLQEIDLAGRIELEREEDGYRVTTLETPSHVEIRADSGLADQLELLCRGFSVMALGALDCESLDQALTKVKLPLPEPGRQYSISRADLTSHEARQIEAYLNQRRP